MLYEIQKIGSALDTYLNVAAIGDHFDFVGQPKGLPKARSAGDKSMVGEQAGQPAFQSRDRAAREFFYAEGGMGSAANRRATGR
jgi:hypothetical protein